MNIKKAKITQKKSLTHDVVELVLTPTEPVSYEAGQFISIKVPTTEGKFGFRSYSIGNTQADREEGIIRLGVKFMNGGYGSAYLKERKKGDELEFTGPSGFFTFQSQNADNIYMICTGTGIAPLLAMAEERLKNGHEGKFHMIFGVRYKVDIFWQDRLEALAEKHDNFIYDITLSKPVGYWEGYTGYVTHLLETAEFDWERGHFYLCGLPDMIDDVKAFLKDRGTSDEQIFDEKYTSPGMLIKERSK